MTAASPAAPAPAAALPDVAGHFRLEQVLGSGAEATVFRATDLRTGEPAAVKVFREPRAAGTRRRELLIHSRLRHSYIVSLTSHGTGERASRAGGPDYAAMELVDGRNLQSVLRDGPADPDLTASWLHCLLKALVHIHARGIIHHDIKPSNILVPCGPGGGLTGVAKLTDFGIATSSLFPPVPSTSGTAHYMSPEQASGTGSGAPGDVYSLGLVALECLTGTKQFPGTPIESMVARTLRPPRVPDTLDRRWARLLTAMTALDPAERVTARQALRLLRRLRRPGSIGIEQGAGNGQDAVGNCLRRQ